MDRKVAIRILVGAGLLAVTFGLLSLDAVTGTAMGTGGLILLCLLGGMIELFRMGATGQIHAPRGVAIACLVLTVAGEVCRGEIEALRNIPFEEAGITLLVLLLLVQQLRREISRDSLLEMGYAIFTYAYLWVLARYALKIRFLPAIGVLGLVHLILVAKGTDIFAFFAGKLLGRNSPKITPRISPNKTRAGFIGGVLGSAAISTAIALATDLGTVLAWPHALGLGILLGVWVQIGDWVESSIKRCTGSKDSGSFLPEFGGFLDIIDSILFGAPVVYYHLLLLQRCS